MNSQFIYTFIKVSGLIALILSLIFCVLTLFVLVYYIRRRYKLYQEINRLPQELLVLESYKNHLKNIKIRSISNFIIHSSNGILRSSNFYFFPICDFKFSRSTWIQLSFHFEIRKRFRPVSLPHLLFICSCIINVDEFLVVSL